MGEELEKNKKIIEELKREKEEALRYGHRMKAMNKNLEKEVNEMEAKLLDKQNIIDQMNDRCAEMKEERDLFASNLEEIIAQKYASIDDNSINEKEKTEAIQKSQESFLDSSLLNGNLGWTASEMNGSDENKMKKKEKKQPVQMQRKHFPTLCTTGHSFRFMPNGNETLDMNEREYCDKNMFYEKILIENECEDASGGYIFDILKAAKPLTPHEMTKNVFSGKMYTQTGAQWMKSADTLKYLELQQATRSQHNYE